MSLKISNKLQSGGPFNTIIARIAAIKRCLRGTGNPVEAYVELSQLEDEVCEFRIKYKWEEFDI